MAQQLLTESSKKPTRLIAHHVSPPAHTQSVQGVSHSPLLQLQRTLGNQHVAQLVQAKRLTPQGKILGLQRKLTVGAAGDQYEQEADRVARQVVSMPDAVAANSMQRAIAPEEDKEQKIQTKPLAASITPVVQRQMGTDKEEDKDKPIQPKSATSLTDSFEAGADVESQLSHSKGGGSPLPDPVRAYMEPRFGVDFGHVRVHTGSHAVQMNRSVAAQAFTHGADIYYGAGSSPTNLELTAHELTHVVQQNGNGIRRKMPLSEPHDTHKVEADQMVRAVIQQEHQTTEGVAHLVMPTVQRQPESDDNESDRPEYPPDWQYGAPTRPVAPDPHVAPDPNQQPEPPDQGPYRTPRLRRRLVEALGIGLGLVAFAALVACFATGVCEAATIIAVVGAGAFLVVMGILKSMGVGVSGGAATVATDQGSSSENDGSSA